MATTNISRIVRGNLNFKPWIAAKNTTEIVNSYVEKFYKQIPNGLKNDLMKARLGGAPKTENRFPFRKVVVEKFTIPIINNKPFSKLRSNGYRSPAMTAKNSFVATAPKKLLKTPNLKIYARRRYTSSVSSSKSSFVRIKTNSNEEYRKKIYTPAVGIQFQTFRGTDVLPNAKYYDNSVISKYMVPTRLFNEVNNRSKPVEVSKAICNDLMSIDDVLKKRICIAKQKSPTVEPLEIPKQNLFELSFKGWNHPSIEHYNKLRAAPSVVVKKPKGSLNSEMSSFGLMAVKRKVYTGKVSNSGTASRRPDAKTIKENNLPQPLSLSLHDGINGKFRGLKIDEQYSKKKSGAKSYNPREALDFVCLSRTERRDRNRNY